MKHCRNIVLSPVDYLLAFGAGFFNVGFTWRLLLIESCPHVCNCVFLSFNVVYLGGVTIRRGASSMFLLIAYMHMYTQVIRWKLCIA